LSCAVRVLRADGGGNGVRRCDWGVAAEEVDGVSRSSSPTSGSSALSDLVVNQITKSTRTPSTGTKTVNTTRRTLTAILSPRFSEMKFVFRKRRISSQIPTPRKATQSTNTTKVHNALIKSPYDHARFSGP
jgi:hypothetical protein